MAVLIMLMAQQNKPNNNNATNITNISDSQQQVKFKPMLFNFLGMKPSPDSLPVIMDPKLTFSEPSLTSVGASSGGCGGGGGGGHGTISSSSDLASERQVGDHLEGVPFYGARTDVSGPEISNRLVGSKRSNSDSGFRGHDYPENLHLMKRNAAEEERSRRSNDDEMFHRMQQLRANASVIDISRIDTNVSRWERTNPINVGPAVQYPPRRSKLVPFIHQVPANRFRDANASPSIISQSAADEGSRTGIKGPSILNSINAIGGPSEKNSSALLPSGSKPTSRTVISEPESSTSSWQQLSSAGRQMTIFYGGQAHVYDDVHPNKADVIMALAGSNGGSWSTTYSPKSAARPVVVNLSSSGEHEAHVTGNTASPQDFRRRLSVMGNTSHIINSNDRISSSTGLQGGVVRTKDTRNPNQAAEPVNEDKR